MRLLSRQEVLKKSQDKAVNNAAVLNHTSNVLKTIEKAKSEYERKIKELDESYWEDFNKKTAVISALNKEVTNLEERKRNSLEPIVEETLRLESLKVEIKGYQDEMKLMFTELSREKREIKEEIERKEQITKTALAESKNAKKVTADSLKTKAEIDLYCEKKAEDITARESKLDGLIQSFEDTERALKSSQTVVEAQKRFLAEWQSRLEKTSELQTSREERLKQAFEILNKKRK